MPNSENVKIQNFGRGRKLGQSDHYFRPYFPQKTLIILYGPRLWSCFITQENGTMIVLIANSDIL